MTRIGQDSLAALEFEVTWESAEGKHIEVLFAEHVNLWRDLLPGEVYQALMGKQAGDRVHLSFDSGDIAPPYQSELVRGLSDRQFAGPIVNGLPLQPRYGRFYPKGLLRGVTGVFQDNMEPFRCLGVGRHGLTVDFNHPLSAKAVVLEVRVRAVGEKASDRGGRLTDWMEVVTSGPGMQVRSNGRPTDFFSDNPFARSDEELDALFYRRPRLITHIDGTAQETIRRIYGGLLQPHGSVLDLMSSWRSHVPDDLQLETLVGLGMNEGEMAENPRLSRYLIHDLNREPSLPFEDQSFDAVICSVSVEYMIRPFDVFREVARILKPHGYFIHTFSNRWFPPKVISLWQELSEFERTGLVLEYFLESGAYENLQTYSARGRPRPETDRYYPKILTSDPVYAVWGQRAG